MVEADDGVGAWYATLATRLLLAFVLFAIFAIIVMVTTMWSGNGRTMPALTAVPLALLLLAENMKTRMSVRTRVAVLMGCMVVVTIVTFMLVGF